MLHPLFFAIVSVVKRGVITAIPVMLSLDDLGEECLKMKDTCPLSPAPRSSVFGTFSTLNTEKGK